MTPDEFVTWLKDFLTKCGDWTEDDSGDILDTISIAIREVENDA